MNFPATDYTDEKKYHARWHSWKISERLILERTTSRQENNAIKRRSLQRNIATKKKFAEEIVRYTSWLESSISSLLTLNLEVFLKDNNNKIKNAKEQKVL